MEVSEMHQELRFPDQQLIFFYLATLYRMVGTLVVNYELEITFTGATVTYLNI